MVGNSPSVQKKTHTHTHKLKCLGLSHLSWCKWEKSSFLDLLLQNISDVFNCNFVNPLQSSGVLDSIHFALYKEIASSNKLFSIFYTNNSFSCVPFRTYCLTPRPTWWRSLFFTPITLAITILTCESCAAFV